MENFTAVVGLHKNSTTYNVRKSTHSLTTNMKNLNSEQWEAVLLSSRPEDQLWAVQLAEDAARA